MEKEIKDYLHLYLGCEIITGTGVKTLTCSELQCIDFFEEFEFVKPILRPLSDMNEEESKEVCKYIRDPKALQVFRTCFGKEFINPSVTRYLLSRHFDLFNLIHQGLAVNKCTSSQYKLKRIMQV